MPTSTQTPLLRCCFPAVCGLTPRARKRPLRKFRVKLRNFSIPPDPPGYLLFGPPYFKIIAQTEGTPHPAVPPGRQSTTRLDSRSGAAAVL